MNLRVNVGSENGYGYAILEGTRFSGDADTVDGALDDLVAALRDYARDWARLKAAPNHAANVDLVGLVSSCTDAELRQLLAAAAAAGSDNLS